MKKQLLFSLLILMAGLSMAQPIITNTDLLKVGDIVVTQPCATTIFNPGGAGANQVWDFSQLVPEGPQDTTFYISPAGTPYAANYPSANIVGRFGADAYGYYQVVGDQLLFWGQADPSSSLVLTNPAVYFQSPTTYGTLVVDSIAGTLTAVPLSGALAGQVYFEADGYGTLLTPGGQFDNVLRTKTVTIGVATVPFIGTIIDSVFNYSWYQLGVKSPVLEMIEDTQWANGAVFAQTRYVNFFNSITSPTEAPHDMTAPRLQACPNPTDGQVIFAGLEKPARLTIRNAAGQVVLAADIKPGLAVNVENLPAGVYVCAIMGMQAVRLVRR